MSGGGGARGRAVRGEADPARRRQPLDQRRRASAAGGGPDRPFRGRRRSRERDRLDRLWARRTGTSAGGVGEAPVPRGGRETRELAVTFVAVEAEIA